MAFRTAWVLLLAFAVIVVGGVTGAAFGEEEGNNGDSEWPAGISPLDGLSYWRNDDDNDAKTPETDDNAPCCLPKLWTGRLFTEVRLERLRSRTTYRYVHVVYFDEANKRLAGDVIAGNRTVVSNILLFNGTGATQYTFSRAAKWCNKRFLPGTMIRPLCIPPNATLLRSFSLGAGSGALKTQSWGYRQVDRRVDNAVNLLVTPGNCVPVISAVASTVRDGPRRRAKLYIGNLFTDMETSITDQSVFTPPPSCKQGDEEGGEEEGGEGGGEEEEGGEEDKKLYFDHHDSHIDALIESFVAVP